MTSLYSNLNPYCTHFMLWNDNFSVDECIRFFFFLYILTLWLSLKHTNFSSDSKYKIYFFTWQNHLRMFWMAETNTQMNKLGKCSAFWIWQECVGLIFGLGKWIQSDVERWGTAFWCSSVLSRISCRVDWFKRSG